MKLSAKLNLMYCKMSRGCRGGAL
uniref:Uncharacterized protein n=1 Tax=Anguilla anguilla TaxID=7936 RepID=A0A0E9QRC1_ANGAN